MILSLGKDTAIPVSDIVFIFNTQNITSCKDTLSLLENLQEKCTCVYIEGDKAAKSIVYARHGQKHVLYYSIIGSVTLMRRGNHFLKALVEEY